MVNFTFVMVVCIKPPGITDLLVLFVSTHEMFLGVHNALYCSDLLVSLLGSCDG